MSEIEITALGPSPKIRAMLSEIMIEVVENGGSVSFMHPLARETADAFWDDALASAARGERIVLGPGTARSGRHRSPAARPVRPISRTGPRSRR